MDKSLLDITQTFPTCSVLCIGDIMLDRFRYGEVTRISPEAPVPVLKITHERTMLGGAGNVAANARALGCNTSILTVIGHDAEGEEIQKLLNEQGITAYCHKTNIRTTTKTRHLTGNTHLLREDLEDTVHLTKQERTKLNHQLNTLISQADVLLLSDYNKGLLTPDLTQYIIKTARKYKKPVLVDPKGMDYSKYTGATLVKPNLKELSEVTGKVLSAETSAGLHEISIAAQDLKHKHHIQNLIVTLGHKGMLAISRQPLLYVPTEAHEVFDVSGAGDTSLATLGAVLAKTDSLTHAIRLANITAGMVVAKSGTATISAKELQDHLGNNAPALPKRTNERD